MLSLMFSLMLFIFSYLNEMQFYTEKPDFGMFDGETRKWGGGGYFQGGEPMQDKTIARR